MGRDMVNGHFEYDIPDHGAATISFWMRARSLSGSRTLVGHDGVWVIDNGNPIHGYNWGSGDVISGGSIPLNTCVHFLVYTTAGQVYINNVLQASGGSLGNTAYLNIGGRNAGRMDGVGSEYALWNVFLNANERAALAKGVCPLLIRRPNLYGYWPMYFTGAANAAPDLSGRKYHMNPSGSPAYSTLHPGGSLMAL
jgi:hypothetical protein